MTSVPILVPVAGLAGVAPSPSPSPSASVSPSRRAATMAPPTPMPWLTTPMPARRRALAVALPPDPRLDAPASAALRLPFDGTWWAGEAPTPEIGNHHLAAPEQRHAYDFSVWRDGATHRDDGDENAEYFAWDQPVLAPGAGTVVDVRDGIADNRPQVETKAEEPAGNHVVVEVGAGEYALFAHLRAGTVAVAEGDVITAGEVIGRTGNSGNSSEPHLHFHLQDLPTFEPGTGTGIPVRFEQHLANGVEQDLGAPSGGQFVSAITD